MKQKRHVSCCSKGKCRQRIQNFGLDLTRRLGRSWQQDSMQKPMETLWRRCGEKGVQVYWTRTYQESISMLLILACSTDCTVAKLFRSNHFEMFCLSNLMRWKGQHHSVQRRGRSPRQRHWLWGVMTRIVMPVVASIWVQYLCHLCCFVQLATGSVKGQFWMHGIRT